MCLPTEWGGGGRPAIERFAVVEALISEGAPIATAWFADRQIGPTLLQFGTDEQRHRFLPDIIAGTSKWCVGMSEPDAGSDVASGPAPGPTVTATIGSSTARRSGRRAPPSPTGRHVIARTDPDACTARRPLGVHRRPPQPRGRDPHHPRHERRSPLLRSALQRRSRARRPAGGHTQRRVQADHAADGA